MIQETGRKKINLALQGGGAFGAFTWGVLDHILEDGRLDIDGVSGASAGAINAIILKDGLARGGPNEARTRLADFWRAASINGNLPKLQRKVIDALFQPAKIWLEVVSNFQPTPLPLPLPLASPYDSQPLNINPLKELIERFVDFEAVRKCEGPKLFISATNVETGKLHIFSDGSITAEAVAASACLPNLFRAVEIEGTRYWDGAFLANPPIFPLLQTTATKDILLVQLIPFQRPGAPASIAHILRRLIEIASNSPLMGELRAIEYVNRLIEGGRLHLGGQDGYKRVNMHRVMLDAFGKELDLLGPANTDFDFFEMLRDLGREAARRFLDAHFEDIGVRETMDLDNEVRAITEFEVYA
jgi:NTE family protein